MKAAKKKYVVVVEEYMVSKDHVTVDELLWH